MYDGPIIDVDLHHRWHSEDDLIAYVSPEWRDVVDRSRSDVLLEAAVASYHHSTGTNKRTDAAPGTGGPAGSDYATTREQWLDPFPVERAVLTFDVGTSAGIRNPYLATELCRAANDWSVARWIDAPGDHRIYTTALAPTHLPEDGAREVRRMAEQPRCVAVLVVANTLDKPLGHPIYHPIYEAAEECGLPVAIHNGGEQWMFKAASTAAGMPNTRFEFHTLVGQSGPVHLASFITHGVFEKFPRLKLLVMEFGIAWLPWLMWTMDRHYSSLRQESRWVKRLPSEYVRDHVRLSTQPLESTARANQLVEALEAAEGMEDVLVFASDYPHFDTDDPRYIAGRLPESWHAKVFYGNAASVLRWPDSA